MEYFCLLFYYLPIYHKQLDCM
ncbi:hypothetical protein SPND122_00450 [Streptococcus pneumoniae]|nr:hypothetical protein SPND122_00450 [Streptococcus pneumoniae]AOG57484.1 hypothetical protein SPND141_00452 [Streptococcus pneumoniae]